MVKSINQPKFVADWLPLGCLSLAHGQDPSAILVDKCVFNRHLGVVREVTVLLRKQVVCSNQKLRFIKVGAYMRWEGVTKSTVDWLMW